MDDDLSAARVRLERMAEWLRDNAEEWGEPDAVAIDVILAALAEAQEAVETVRLIEFLCARGDMDRLSFSGGSWYASSVGDRWAQGQTLLAALQSLAARLDGAAPHMTGEAQS